MVQYEFFPNKEFPNAIFPLKKDWLTLPNLYSLIFWENVFGKTLFNNFVKNSFAKNSQRPIM